MTQLVRMIAISVLTGGVAAGAVWLAWDLGYRSQSSMQAWRATRREKRRLKDEAAALLKQARPPNEAQRPR